MIQSLPWDGERIGAPGIYSGVPLAFYHGDSCVGPCISSSGLRTIWRDSPAHYWATSPYNPKRVEREHNPAFDLGAAAHHWLLGEAHFAKHFVLSPFDDFRTKEARAWRDAERDAGRTVLTPDQMDAVLGMREGLMANPLVSDAGILDGAIEQSFFWHNDGIWLRARPDVVPNASGDFSDLKTTVSVQRDYLMKSLAEYGYPMQAALVRQGCQALGIPFTSFSFVFIEKAAPYAARVVTLKDAELDRADKQIAACVKAFANCLSDNRWPVPGGDQTDAEWIELPEWASRRIDERLAIIEQTGAFA